MAHHHHHHHPQLTAHSQLVPGQLNYNQLPVPAPLPSFQLPTSNFQSFCSTPANFQLEPHQILRSSSIVHEGAVILGGRLGGCIICFGSLPPRIARGVCNSTELFQNFCKLLDLPLNEIQHEWDFENGDKLPFCMACTKAIQVLVSLQNQLEVIQRKLSDGIEDIRNKIQQSENRVHGADLRTANFRSRVLGTRFLRMSTTPSHQESTRNLQSGSDDECRRTETDDISDFSFMLNPLLPGMQHPATDQSHSELSKMSSQSSSSFLLHEPIETIESQFPSSTDLIIKKTIRKKDKRKCKNPSKSMKQIARKEKPLKSQGRQNLEHFAPFQTSSTGQVSFEGIAITLTPSGYLCGSCGALCGKGEDKASIRKIKIHIKGVHLEAYRCPICSKPFTTNDILLQHTTRFHNQDDITCDVCGRPVRPRNLRTHKFTHMNVEEKEVFIIETGFKPSVSRNTEPKYMCNSCGKMFKKQFLLKRHEASHLDKELRKYYKCDKHNCEKSYTTYQYLKEHQTLHHQETNGTGPGRTSICKHCGKLMHHRYLRKHLHTHISKEDRPLFQCKICGTRVVNKRVFEKHKSSHDLSDKAEMYKFECEVCGKRFVSLKGMRTHRKKSHQNKKLVVSSKLTDEINEDKPDKDKNDDG